MNKEVGKVVDEVLNTDLKARESDLRLIYKVLNKLIGINENTSIWAVFLQMKTHKISFESITRHRRKWLEKHPDIKANLKATPIREQEEENYIVEYSPEISKHIPYID